MFRCGGFRARPGQLMCTVRENTERGSQAGSQAAHVHELVDRESKGPLGTGQAEVLEDHLSSPCDLQSRPITVVHEEEPQSRIPQQIACIKHGEQGWNALCIKHGNRSDVHTGL